MLISPDLTSLKQRSRCRRPAGSLAWSRRLNSSPARVLPCSLVLFRRLADDRCSERNHRPRSLDTTVISSMVNQYSSLLSRVRCALHLCRARCPACSASFGDFDRPMPKIAPDWSSPWGFDNGSLALLVLGNRSWANHSLQTKKRLLPLADTPFFHLLASPARIPVQHRNPN